jgi:uncharacterized protein
MPLGSRRSCHNALVEPLTEIAVRRLEEIVPQLMAEEPVVVLTGPRTVGKSTLLHRLAAGVNRRVLDLDDVATRALVRQDLGLYLTGEPPVLIDEFQHVPEILDAIKAELNRDLRPGRFVLTGSTRYSTLPRAAQSLTGRVHLENVWPLSQGELAGVRERFVQRLLDDPAHLVSPEASRATREEYVERVLAGGLPVALRRRPGRSRSRWFEDYLTLIVERDVLEISNVRQSAALPLLLRRLAAQTAQVLNIAHASREAGITTSVGEDYVRLLESVFLVHRLPAWGTTLTVRVNRLPKIHLVDSGLAGWLLGLTGASVGRRIPAGMAQFGHLLETFVVNELLKQAAWLDQGVRAGHYRTSDGHEVDLVLETEAGGVVAVEVKAGGTYRSEDLRGLRQLRDRLGERFHAGVLIYTGQLSARVDDRISVLPVDALWQ